MAGRPKGVLNPHKFTPERRNAILESIAKRIPYGIAAPANGIAESTLFAWLYRGRMDMIEGKDTDYSNFLESLKKIEQDLITLHSNKLNSNIERWQSDSWLLERRFWKEYSSSAAVIEFNKRLDAMEEGFSEEDIDTMRMEANNLKENDKDVKTQSS